MAAGLIKDYRQLYKISSNRLNILRRLCTQQPNESVRPAGGTELPPKPYSEMPSVKSYPIVGSFLPILLFSKEFDKNKINLFFSGLVEKHGPIFSMNTSIFEKKLFKAFVITTNPDDYETVMRATLQNPIREAFHALKHLRDNHPDNFFEKKGGLLPENHEEWWRVRSRAQTSMLKQKNVSKYLRQMDQVSQDFMNVISDLQKKHGEMPANFVDELYKWALESVSVVALNRRLNCLEPNLAPDSPQLKLIQTVNAMFDAMNMCNLSQLWRIYPTKDYKTLVREHQVVLELAYDNILETEKQMGTKASEDEMSLMETLLNVPGLSRKDVVTLIIDMLFAGIDTTAHTIGFTLYLLARNPAAQKRLQEEIDKVVGDSQDPLTDEQITNFTYLKACIKESMRLFPILVGTARLLEEDIVLSGYTVPKKSMVIGLHPHTCKSDEVFQRSAEFLPERWFRERPLGPIHPFASLPFSHGRRMCIGRRIAEQEIYTFLIRALQRFDVRYNYEDMEIVTRLVNTPSQPLRFEFLDRKKEAVKARDSN